MKVGCIPIESIARSKQVYRDCLMEEKDIYILLVLALLGWRQPVSPH
jgi:hypothetical protein